MEEGSKRKKISKKWLILLSVAILLLVIGIIIYSIQFTIFKFSYENGNESIAKRFIVLIRTIQN